MKIKLKLFFTIAVILFISACTEEGDSFKEMNTDAFYAMGMNGIEGLPFKYNEKYKDYEENPFVKVKDQPVST
ncbi:MAG: hypothetical protein GQ525_05095, partial [Draconibacterium sp.]|nr:hypothetical protein [Draconibacterium sp.]